MFRPPSGHQLQNSSIKSKTYEKLAHYGIHMDHIKIIVRQAKTINAYKNS
jgi:hypothetical protein